MECKIDNGAVTIPKGAKIVVEAVEVMSFDNNTPAYEYNIFLSEELQPLHRLQENPIRDYSDYEDKPFFESKEDMINALSKENILSFINKNHPELIKYITNKGLMLCSKWIPYEELTK